MTTSPPLGLNSQFEPIDVGGLVGVISQEVEGSPVVPQIIRLTWLPLCDVCDHPLDAGIAVAKAPLVSGKRGSGKIEKPWAGETFERAERPQGVMLRCGCR